MSGILSQDEIDALLTNFSGAENETEVDEPDQPSDLKPYDLTRQDRVIRHPMPALDIIFERFSKSYRTHLSALLRKIVDITISSQKIIKLGDLMKTLPVPTSLHIFRMEPLSGSGLLIFQSDLVFSLIDILFGGKGSKTKVEGREFTAIENRMIKRLRNAALKTFEESWASIYKVNCSVTRSEINPQFVSIAPSEELVQISVFDVEIEAVTGEFTICLPYSMLEPIKDYLRSRFHESENSSRWRQRWQQILLDAPVNIVAELGSTVLTCQELLNLNKGDILMLDRSIDDPLELKVEGLTKFRGFPGTYKDSIAVQVASFEERK
ncbi:MAG: flagellar motor switch protein FliM [Deltaproteobacteria bacterium]|nr:flagellar motor switch protein FliM [Deltaproteobacteria bacterium]MBW2308205.1 flagellar motor switch protein FliM [Deltaproteobacteria bacterium]